MIHQIRLNRESRYWEPVPGGRLWQSSWLAQGQPCLYGDATPSRFSS